jgi:Icc-related predicted phosphoesterase
MRLLAAADIHGFENVLQWIVGQARSFQVDALVLAGDLLGVPHGFETVEQAMLASAKCTKQILSSAACPVLYIMGNDDLVDLGPDVANITSIHGRRVELEDFGLVGYQCGPPFMGGPFERTEADLENELKVLDDLIDESTVLVTHYPAVGTLDGGFGLCGIRALVEQRPVLAHIHGHSHSTFGNRANRFNVASAAQKRAMLIDLNARTFQVVGDLHRHRELPW